MSLQFLNLTNIPNFIRHAYALIITRNPCKKCLVKACCSRPCEEKMLLDNFLFPSTVIYKNKIIIILTSIHWLFLKYNMYLHALILLSILLVVMDLWLIITAL